MKERPDYRDRPDYRRRSRSRSRTPPPPGVERESVWSRGACPTLVVSRMPPSIDEKQVSQRHLCICASLKLRTVASGGASGARSPISCLAPWLLHASHAVFEMCPPSVFWSLLVFGPTPAAISWRRACLSWVCT